MGTPNSPTGAESTTMLNDEIDLLADPIEPTAPAMFATMTSPEGEIIDLYRTAAFGHLTLVRYDPTQGETQRDGWLRVEPTLSSGARCCGNYVYPAMACTAAYSLIGRLVAEDGWTIKAV